MAPHLRGTSFSNVSLLHEGLFQINSVHQITPSCEKQTKTDRSATQKFQSDDGILLQHTCAKLYLHKIVRVNALAKSPVFWPQNSVMKSLLEVSSAVWTGFGEACRKMSLRGDKIYLCCKEGAELRMSYHACDGMIQLLELCSDASPRQLVFQQRLQVWFQISGIRSISTSASTFLCVFLRVCIAALTLTQCCAP